MNFLRNFKIGTRLGAGFGIITLLLVILSVVGIVKLKAVDADMEVIVHDRYAKVALSHTIENEMNRQARALRTAMLTTDTAIQKAELAKIESSVPVIAGAIEKLRATIHSEAGKQSLAALLSARAAFKDKEGQLIKLIEAGDLDRGRAFLLQELLPLQTTYLAALEAFTQTQVDGMEHYAAEADATVDSTHALMVSMAVIATLLASAIGFVLTRSITRPIADAVRVAERVASGDLSSTVAVSGKDETSQLLQALRQMNESLAGIVGQVRDSSDSISTGSSQIATGNADLSQRTEEQASNLQQTAASMEQITATVRQSAEAARAATALANSASQVAARGGAVVGEVVSTMTEITAGSRKIADITSVIDGIAFQTNILALNAAVEAARAGEHGRGFAVVAGEVRTLAQRAATAAREIKALIGQSVTQVETGASLVGRAGSTMDEIVSQVKRVAQLITEIDTATQEQTTGIGQVGHAVSQLDQVTQQNAALVEESASAAESLSQQAMRLTQLVSAFRLAPSAAA